MHKLQQHMLRQNVSQQDRNNEIFKQSLKQFLIARQSSFQYFCSSRYDDLNVKFHMICFGQCEHIKRYIANFIIWCVSNFSICLLSPGLLSFSIQLCILDKYCYGLFPRWPGFNLPKYPTTLFSRDVCMPCFRCGFQLFLSLNFLAMTDPEVLVTSNTLN